MSEIFSSLKRTDAEKNKRVTDIGPARVEVREIPPEDVEKMQSTTAVVQSAPQRAEISSTIQFDLGLADYRVKNVLDPVTLVGEQFRLLRAALTQIQKQRGIKILLMTSACPNEGKTFCACSLAGILAQEPGKRVLLVDSDLRKPYAGKQIGLKTELYQAQGFSAVLRGEASVADVILSSMEGSLFLLPAGKVPDNPSELLSSPELGRALRTTKDLFDWVVIDSPPILALSDATVLAPACDAVLLVVHAGVTSSRFIKDAVQRIGREKIVGIVLNRLKHLKSSSSYYHYYRRRQKK